MRFLIVLGCIAVSILSGCKEEPGDIKIGVSMYTLGAPYFVAQFETLKSEAEREGRFPT
jgi:ABC-type sugar transport system substrate-binding protein